MISHRSSRNDRQQLLDPVDRISEILFGLIMAVTIVGSLSIASAGHAEVRTVLAAALGCNLAWGLVDAVMYLVRTLTGRTRNRFLASRVLAATDKETAHRLIAQTLPEQLIAITGPQELEGMRLRLAGLAQPAVATLDGKDYLAAGGVFLLVVLATFPVVVPFMLTDDVARAMNASRVLTVIMLFAAGFGLGQYAGHRRPSAVGTVMAVFGVALIAAVKALGG